MGGDRSLERNGLIIPDDGWREAIELYPSSSSSVHQLVVPIEEIVSPRAQASKARHVLSVFQRIQTCNISDHVVVCKKLCFLRAHDRIMHVCIWIEHPDHAAFLRACHGDAFMSCTHANAVA